MTTILSRVSESVQHDLDYDISFSLSVMLCKCRPCRQTYFTVWYRMAIIPVLCAKPSVQISDV